MTQGKTIGVFSPSSAILRDRFDIGANILEQHGYKLVIHPQTYSGADTGTQLAGTTEDKIKAYADLASDQSIDFIMAATGGNRACFLLPELEKLPSHKPIMGFSDITALLAAHYKMGIKGWFGPTVQTFARMDQHHIDLTFNLLSGDHPSISFKNAETIKNGTVTAPIFAATLSNLCALIGTPHFPDLSGHILILEDIGDELNRYDRMLWQIFATIKPAGLVFGQFIDNKDTGRPYGEFLNQIIKKHSQHIDTPIISNADIGHDGRIFPIPVGQNVTLNATNRALIF